MGNNFDRENLCNQGNMNINLNPLSEGSGSPNASFQDSMCIIL